MSTLGDKLRAAREARGIIQREAADAISAPHNYLSRWENGKNIPDRWHTSLLAKLYDLDVDDLLLLREAEEKARDEVKRATRPAGDVAAALEVPDEARTRRGDQP